MRNIYIRHEGADGKMLPEGEMEIRKFGPGGFTIKLQLPPMTDTEASNAAFKYLQDIQQVMHYMSGGATVGDVEKGLRIVADMEAYFTTWRYGPKLVEVEKLEAMRIDRDYQQSAKEALQRDNDDFNKGEPK